MAEYDQNHTMFAGETKTITCTNRVKSTNALIDFTAATITWVLKKGSTAELTKTTSSGISVTATGIFTITLTSANTSSLVGDYEHECRATLQDSSVVTLFSGVITIYPTITT